MKQVRKRKADVMYERIYVESRKTALTDLFAGQQWRCRCSGWSLDTGRGWVGEVH